MLLLFRNITVKRFVKPLILSFSVLAPVSGYAAEWSVAGHVDQAFAYDDNVRMFPGGIKEGSFWYRILPTLTFAHKTDASEVSANASYGTQVYTDLPQFDQDIQHYGLNGVYRTDRIDWGGSFSYSILPVRNQGFQTGNFDSNATNDSWSVAPSIAYRLSEIDSLIFVPSYSKTSFSNQSAAEASSFRNFDNINLNLAWQRMWTERYSTNISLFGAILDSTNGSSSSTGVNNANPQTVTNNSVGINFGNSYDLSQNWKLDGTVGVRHTDTKVNSIQSSSIGFLANAGVRYTDENYNTGLYFSRSLNPSNFGQLQEQTIVGMDFGYRIFEHLSVGLRTDFQHSSIVNSTGLSNNINSRNRDNLVVQPSVNWGFARDWSMSGTYRYRTQDTDSSFSTTANGNAESNMFMLSVNYRWPGFRLSK